MAKSLTSPEERVALFQQLFSDTIPPNKALGLKVLAVARGLASMQLDWRPELVGTPETGVVAGGPLTAMLDATPGQPVIAEAECYRITRSVAFTRAFAHQGDPKDPVAAAAGTFMLGTKGEVTAAQAIGKERLK